MASRPRVGGHRDRMTDKGRGGITVAGRVDDILAACPASMGSGLMVDDTDGGRQQRVQAISQIKHLLQQVKANLKVFSYLPARA